MAMQSNLKLADLSTMGAPSEAVSLNDEQWVSDAWIESIASRQFELQRLAVFAAKAQDRIALPIKDELLALTEWLGDGCPGGPWHGVELVNNIMNILEKRSDAKADLLAPKE
ncbi:hypothetical protein [Ottowia sp. VDI28]|uniref:hypothetical protein n=1 Tax=Ottowia sp. VDI28 TaxID=3133968 RepID=UPI003C2DD7C8